MTLTKATGRLDASSELLHDDHETIRRANRYDEPV